MIGIGSGKIGIGSFWKEILGRSSVPSSVLYMQFEGALWPLMSEGIVKSGKLYRGLEKRGSRLTELGGNRLNYEC